MQPTPAEAFNAWVQLLGFRGRHTLKGLRPSLKQQLHNIQKMYNQAFAAEKLFPEHVVTLPLYFDYIDADSENAIATNDERHYAFVGITLPLVFKISDVSLALSRSTTITTALPLRVADEPYNALQGTLFYILLSFVVGHEWAHHRHDHLPQQSSPKAIFQEVLNTNLTGNIKAQLQEIGADGYSAFFLLSHLLDHRDTFLPFLDLNPGTPPALFDQIFLSLFVISFASYLLLRPPEILSAENVYRLTHPPAATRMNFLMREIAAWCSHNRPALEEWLRQNGWALINVSALAILGTDGATSWGNQLDFLKSEEGKKYTTTLTEGLVSYRKNLWQRDTDETH
jgi:hypothetical protein